MKQKETSTEIQIDTRSKGTFIPRRYIMAFLAFLTSVATYTQRLNLSFALVDMVNATSSVSNYDYGTECPDTSNGTYTKTIKGAEFAWNTELQGLILSATYFGYCITQFPGGLLCERLGVKNLMLIGMVTGAITNLISPIAARADPYLFFAVHFIKGLGQGFPVPALSTLSARWFPKPEKGFLSAFVFSGFSLGGFLGSIVSGPVCELELDGGWPLAFYIFGLFGVVISILIIVFYVENPAEDPNISEQELKYILENTNDMTAVERPPTPWKEILTSVPTYALIVALFGQYWVMFYLTTVHPLFMDTVLHISVKENGLLTAGPQFAQSIAAITACLFSFWINKNDTSKINLARKGCNTFAVLMFLIGLGGIYYSGCDITWNEVFLFIASAAPAFTFGGSIIAAVDMTPSYCGPLMGVASTIASLSGFIVPIVTGELTKYEQTMAQWHKMFLITSIISSLNGVSFLILGSTEIQFYDPAYENEKNIVPSHEANTSNTSSHLYGSDSSTYLYYNAAYQNEENVKSSHSSENSTHLS